MSNLKNIVHAAIEKNSVALKEAVTAELNERINERINDMYEDVANRLFGNEVVESEDLDEDEEEDSDEDEDVAESYGVFMQGGSIGDQKGKGKPAKTFDNEADAKSHAARLNKNLSPGEKKHYKIKYTVKPIKEDVEDLDEVSKKTLGSYIKKSAADATSIQRSITRQGIDSPEYKDLSRMRKNRKTGINKAVDKLTKESVEDLEELSVDKVDAYRAAAHKDKKQRDFGRHLAFDKVTGRAKVNATKNGKDKK
jgi:hypothetical protein